MFTKTSRYYELDEHAYQGLDGREILYKGRRLVPRAHRALAERTTVGQNERLDLVAARTVGAGELFWHLCDANDVLNPFDLVVPSGRQLDVPEI